MVELSTRDLALFVYNFGVVISGVLLVSNLGLETMPLQFTVGAVVAVAWTVYFRYRMIRLFTDEEEA